MNPSTYLRRQFLKKTALAGAGLALMNFQNLGCMNPKENPYLSTIGLQLWSVRDQMEADPKGTLTALSKMGYKQVETMDVRHLAELKPMADDLGLDIKSSHFLWTTLTQRWDLVPHEKDQQYAFEQVVETAQKNGISHLVLAYLMGEERNSLDAYKARIEEMNKASEVSQSAGIQLCYHNHSFEFIKYDGQVPYELMIERLDPKGVQFELDVFWAQIGGYDPVKLTQRLADRIRLLHLKDLQSGTPVMYDEGKVPHEAFKELGNGVVDIAKIVDIAMAEGIDYCFVEQDWSDDPLKSMEQSVRFFETI